MIGSGGRRLALAALAVGLVAVGGLLALSASLVTTDSHGRRDLTVVVGPGDGTVPAPAVTRNEPPTSTRAPAEGEDRDTIADVSGGGAAGGAEPDLVVPVASPRRAAPAGPDHPGPRGRRSPPVSQPTVPAPPPAAVVVPVVGVPTVPVSVPVVPVVTPPPADVVSPSDPGGGPPAPAPVHPSPPPPSPPPADTDEPPPATSPSPPEATEPGEAEKPPPAVSDPCPPDPCPPDPCPPDPCPPDPCP